jgi:predicted nucleic acid-binding protein
LECAVAGRLDGIVTGDKAILALGSYCDVRILTVRQFFDEEAGA